MPMRYEASRGKPCNPNEWVHINRYPLEVLRGYVGSGLRVLIIYNERVKWKRIRKSR